MIRVGQRGCGRPRKKNENLGLDQDQTNFENLRSGSLWIPDWDCGREPN